MRGPEEALRDDIADKAERVYQEALASGDSHEEAYAKSDTVKRALAAEAQFKAMQEEQESKLLAPSGKTLRAQRRKAERAHQRASATRRRTEPTDAQLGFAYLSKLRAETPGFRNVIENGELQ